LEVKIVPLEENTIEAQVDGLDYGIAEIVHDELLKNNKVVFAGVAPPHPLVKRIIIRVKTNGADPVESLTNAIKDATEKVNLLKEQVQKLKATAKAEH
jgi:DNA-directed RNA polymerase subunit L